MLVFTRIEKKNQGGKTGGLRRILYDANTAHTPPSNTRPILQFNYSPQGSFRALHLTTLL